MKGGEEKGNAAEVLGESYYHTDCCFSSAASALICRDLLSCKVMAWQKAFGVSNRKAVLKG